jgi:hypothetical protein
MPKARIEFKGAQWAVTLSASGHVSCRGDACFYDQSRILLLAIRSARSSLLPALIDDLLRFVFTRGQVLHPVEDACELMMLLEGGERGRQ